MKQKIALIAFIAAGLALAYLVFTEEGRKLGSDFVAWVEAIVTF